MKVLKVFIKSLKEQSRDISTFFLSLTLGPFFVLLYWLMIPSGSTTFHVMVLNQDSGTAGAEVISILEQLSYPSGDPLLEVSVVSDQLRAETSLQDRDAEVLLIIPKDFSVSLLGVSNSDESHQSTLTLVGDLTNPYYAVGAIMASSTIDQYIQSTTGESRPISIEEIALGASAARSEFDLYVPGMLIISIVMLVFTVSMTITSEVESGTLRRLQLTKMSAFDLLAGISLSTILLGIIAILLTFLIAVALGFESQGSIWAAVLIGVITAIAVVGVGLIVAAFSNTVSQAFIIANFPLIFFMFFSGAVYPLPRIRLFEVSGQVVSIYDLIPSTHSVVALNKILTLGAGLGDVFYELGSLVVLTLLYFAIGIWVFNRRHLRIT